jgi:hypothetical protein
MQIQWRNAEAENVGRAEITDDTALNQRLHNHAGIRVRETQLTAAPLRLAGRHRPQRFPALLLYKPDKQFGLLERFGAYRFDRRLHHNIGAGVESR